MDWGRGYRGAVGDPGTAELSELFDGHVAAHWDQASLPVRIGVRKALGARRRDITGQFLAEAAALTGAGGVLGIVIAIAATFLIGFLVPSLPSSVPLWAVVAGFSVSVAVGVFFGVWPAMKAAKLDPVEALRYE